LDVPDYAKILVCKMSTIYLATLREDGLPHVRAISVMKSEGLSTIWMITSASDDKAKELELEPRCMIYATTIGDEPDYAELRLWGIVEISADRETIDSLWVDVYDGYFADGGRNDPSILALKFMSNSGVLTTQRGRETLDFKKIQRPFTD
jgi:general stress protein 26